MLLIDGVRYEEWQPPNEDEFEQQVKEHSQDVFGEQSIYLDRKQRLRSLSGIGSIPDGYAVILGDTPHWHIVEVELSSHPLHEHIVSQVSRFMTGISNPNTQREIAKAIYEEITRDELLKLKIEQAIRSGEIYKFLADLIAESPVLTIVIEKDTQGLREATSTLAHSKIKVVEFQTFVREEVGLPVHAHLFEPLHVIGPPPPLSPTPTPSDALEIMVRNPSYIKFHFLGIPKGSRPFFPGYKIPFDLETDMGIIKTWVSSAPAGTKTGDPSEGVYIQANLAEWYRQHPTIQVGDRVIFQAIESGKRYRLELLK